MSDAAIAAGRLDVVFVVDGSGSMAVERIASLNWAVKAAVPAMREAAADHPGIAVTVRAIRFADRADWPVARPTPLDDFVWKNLAAGGESSMGAAFDALTDALARDEPGPPGGLLPAVVVLLSDGLPTDDVGAALARFRASPRGATAICVPIAIGSDADLDLLQEVIGDSDLRPLRADDAEMLASRIRWAASAPIAAAAAPNPAAAAATLAGGMSPELERDGDVW